MALIRVRAAARSGATPGSQAALWPILASLSQLTADPTKAEVLHRQAEAIVEAIAGHIDDAEVRDRFGGGQLLLDCCCFSLAILVEQIYNGKVRHKIVDEAFYDPTGRQNYKQAMSNSRQSVE